MRTEDQFFYEHLYYLIDLLNEKVGEIENKTNLDDQDDMELSALDRLIGELDRM